MIIRIDYPEPEVRLDLWGGTSGSFSGLDAFNRVVDQRWQNDTSTTPTDIDRYQYGYDQNSNRLWKANMVGTGLDELYTYDRINRLNQMQRGTLNMARTAITGTPSVQQNWTLDPTGNWSNFVTAASGTTNLNQTRTSNTVNEITNITESTGPTWIVPGYDAAGNMTTMPQVADPTQSFTATYDAWNRMVSISDSSGTVATYSYDGRNRRIVKATSSETRHFYFTNAWQDIEERTGTSTTMDKQYVWGIRYIDELVCRDDATERLYVCQDANFNVTSITDDTSGDVQERFLYAPYGSCAILDSAWAPTTDAFEWVYGFLGRPRDSATQLYDFRNRDYHQLAAVFPIRDRLPYADGSNLYAALSNNPVNRIDPDGLAADPGQKCSKCLSATLSFEPNPPTWQVGQSSVGFNIVGTFIFIGDPDTVQFFDDETGASTISGGQLDYKTQPNLLPKNMAGGHNNARTSPTFSATQFGSILHIGIATFTDHLNVSIPPGNATGSFHEELVNYTVQIRCKGSLDDHWVKSAKYEIRGGYNVRTTAGSAKIQVTHKHLEKPIELEAPTF